MNQYDASTYGMYNNPDDWYTSPYLHAVTLSGLQAAAEYEYTVPTDEKVGDMYENGVHRDRILWYICVLMMEYLGSSTVGRRRMDCKV